MNQFALFTLDQLLERPTSMFLFGVFQLATNPSVTKNNSLFVRMNYLSPALRKDGQHVKFQAKLWLPLDSPLALAFDTLRKGDYLLLAALANLQYEVAQFSNEQGATRNTAFAVIHIDRLLHIQQLDAEQVESAVASYDQAVAERHAKAQASSAPTKQPKRTREPAAVVASGSNEKRNAVTSSNWSDMTGVSVEDELDEMEDPFADVEWPEEEK